MKAHEWGFPFDHALQERLKKLVLPYLATIIQRRYDQTNKFPTSLYVTITCVDLVRDECYGINKIFLKRTKDKIPAPITTRSQSDFQYVGEYNFAKAFNRVRIENVALQQHKKFTGKDPYYFYDNGHIWVANSNHLEVITISYVPENPLEVIKLQGKTTDCFSELDIKIVPGSLLDGVMSLMDKNRPQIMSPDLETEVDIKE